MSRPVNTDLAAGILGLAIVALFWLGRGQLTHLSSIFPDTILALIALISSALVIKSFARPDLRTLFAEIDRLRVVATAAALLAWWWLIGVLGFFVASVLAFLFLAWWLARVRREVTLGRIAFWLGVIVAEVGFFYLVFSQLLYIRPPSGMLL